MSASNTEVWVDGQLRRLWDATARLRYEYDANGVQIGDPHPFTAEENARADAENAESVLISNRETLEAKAAAAKASNLAFLADTTVTQAEAVTQLQKLTRQVNALIKLQLQDFADLDGTE